MMSAFPALRGLAMAASLLTPVMLSSAAAAEALSPAQKGEVEALIQQYIMDHPEVIVQALQTMQARQEAEAAERQQKAIAALKSTLLADSRNPSTGPVDADVTIIEFFDYQCGYCKKVLPEVAAVLQGDPKVRMIWVDWPILGPMSVVAAQAASAVHKLKPEAYSAFHQTIMGERGRLTEDKIFQAVAGLGLDVADVRKAMGSDDVQAHLAANHAIASQLGITGTPFFLVGDTAVPGAVDADNLRRIIAETRKQAG